MFFLTIVPAADSASDTGWLSVYVEYTGAVSQPAIGMLLKADTGNAGAVGIRHFDRKLG